MPDTPEVIAARVQAAEFNANILNGEAITAPTTPQASLGTVLAANTSSIKYSDSGAGGAILVMPGPHLPTGAAIKVESESSVKTAEKCSQVMEHFFANATGPAPFAAPRIQVYRAGEFGADPNLQTQLAGKFDLLKDDANVQGRWGFNQSKDSVGHVATGETAVVVMEFAQGQQLNKLPTTEKEALIRSGAFAQTMGRSMAPSMALGLTDHGGIHDMGSAHKANISNFMYSPKTGTLSVIDYDSGGTPLDPNNPGGAVRVGGPDTAENLNKMRTFLEQASRSPADFEKALDAMVKPNSNTPFNAMMESFSKHSYDGMFGKGDKQGNPVDQQALKSFSPEERREFAANLLIGAADGLDYLKSNEQALVNAVATTHEVGANGETVEHFYTQQEMDDLHSELVQLDAQTLKTNLDQCMVARQQSLKTGLTEAQAKVKELQDKITPRQERMDTVEKEIDAIRKLPPPSRMDRLKSFLGNKPKAASLVTLNNEREKLKEELRTLYAEKTSTLAAGQDKFAVATHNEAVQARALLPPLPQLPPPGLTNNNVTTTTTTTLGTGQDQNKPQPHHVRDDYPSNRHPDAPGTDVALKTGEKAPKVGSKVEVEGEHHTLRQDYHPTPRPKPNGHSEEVHTKLH
jgi:hypothetical protein